MVKPHNLKEPVLQIVDQSNVKFSIPDDAEIYQTIGELTACWANFEFALTGLLIYHSGMSARNGYLMIGRMSSKSKIEKIIKILKANDHDKQVIDFFVNVKKLANFPCEIRNIISHRTYWGSDVKDEDILYFGGVRAREESGMDSVYAITKKEIKTASDFASDTAQELKIINIRLLQAKYATAKKASSPNLQKSGRDKT